MKNDIIQVIQFLLENYQEQIAEMDIEEFEAMHHSLVAAGVEPEAFARAIQYLESMTEIASSAETELSKAMFPNNSGRDFSGQPLQMDEPSYNLLKVLEGNEVLNSEMRQTVIYRLMALDAEIITLSQLRMVLLTVMTEFPDIKWPILLVDELMFEHTEQTMH